MLKRFLSCVIAACILMFTLPFFAMAESTSYKNYIKKNILDSELSKIFDLSNIDWKEIERSSRDMNLLKSICEDYCENTLFIKEIAKKYYTSSEAINRYIKQGKQLGLIPKDVDGNLRAAKIRVYRNRLGS